MRPLRDLASTELGRWFREHTYECSACRDAQAAFVRDPTARTAVNTLYMACCSTGQPMVQQLTLRAIRETSGRRR